MKRLALTVLLLSALISFAKDRKWQEAKFIKSGSSDSGTVVIPMPSTTTGTVTSYGNSATGTTTTTGGMTFAVPAQTTYYVFRGESAIYVVYFNPLLQWKRPNLTLGSTMRIAPEGNKLYFIDDKGKQAHLPIAEQRLIETTK
jgi:hypothetical protein